MVNLNKVSEKLEKLYQELKKDNDEVSQDIIDLEQELKDELNLVHGKELQDLKVILKKIKSIKREFDFYDEESELGNIFPNGHDDNFDD